MPDRAILFIACRPDADRLARELADRGYDVHAVADAATASALLGCWRPDAVVAATAAAAAAVASGRAGPPVLVAAEDAPTVLFAELEAVFCLPADARPAGATCRRCGTGTRSRVIRATIVHAAGTWTTAFLCDACGGRWDDVARRR